MMPKADHTYPMFLITFRVRLLQCLNKRDAQ